MQLRKPIDPFNKAFLVHFDDQVAALVRNCREGFMLESVFLALQAQPFLGGNLKERELLVEDVIESLARLNIRGTVECLTPNWHNFPTALWVPCAHGWTSFDDFEMEHADD